MREVIPPATPQLTAVKLVQHAISCLEADDRQTSLATLKVLLSTLSRLDGYLDAMSTEGPASLAPLIHETLHHDWAKVYAEKKTSYPVTPQWSAGAYEGGFVAMVARAIGAKRVLEIGMFTGTTTLCVAEALPDDGIIVTLELDQYLKDLVVPYFEKAGVSGKVDVRIGSALQSLEKMQQSGEKPFDLIFVDADKPGYVQYFDTILQSGLLRKNGVMLVDNVLYKGYPYTPEMQTEPVLARLGNTGVDFTRQNGQPLADFNEHVRKDSRVDVVILPIRDGVSWITHKK